MKKIVYLISLSVFLASCFKKQQTDNTESKDEVSTNLVSENKNDNTIGKEYFSNQEEFEKFINTKWVRLINGNPCFDNRSVEIDRDYLIDYGVMETRKCRIKQVKKINSKTLELVIEDNCNYGNTFKVEVINFKEKLVKWTVFGDVTFKAKPYDIICKDWDKTPVKKESYYLDLYKANDAVLDVSDTWKGLYYYKSSQTGIEFILDSRNNTIQLEVGRDQYGYIDQLKAAVKEDTLGLFHHKNISGMNYDDTRSYDFLKFYKSSDGKFYFEGKLPYLPDGAIEFDKVK